jgi:predicted small secreted protein
MKKIALLIVAVLLLTISTVGCNAARGVGQDLQDTGKHVSNIGK